MKLKTLNDVDVKGKKVLIRVDINSPVVNGLIEDNPRFEQSAKTISYLVDKGAKVVIIAHQGRKGDNDFLPLEQHANILTKYCGKKIRYIDELFEDKVSGEINKLKMGDGILLKNVREYNEEKDLINKKLDKKIIDKVNVGDVILLIGKIKKNILSTILDNITGIIK